MNTSPKDQWQQKERAGREHHRGHGGRIHGFGIGDFGGGAFFLGPVPSRPGRPGRRGRRGQVRESILALLAEESLNGYQIMQALAERTQGLWRPSPGAVYPALAQLEDEGLIESFDNEGHKAFRLTEQGKEAAEQAGVPWEAVIDSAEGLDPEAMRALWKEFGGLAGAAKELVRNGTIEQVGAAAGIVSEARRKIYGLLAAAPQEPDPDEGQ